MKAVQIMLPNGTERMVVNLECTTSSEKELNPKTLRIAGYFLELTSQALRNYAYDVVSSLVRGLATPTIDKYTFKKCADKATCESTALTDATAGLKYFDSTLKEMWTNTNVATKTLSAGTAETLHEFAKVPDIDEVDVEECEVGDLYYDDIEQLFYEVELEDEEKAFVPTAGVTTDYYLDQLQRVYTYAESNLQLSNITYFEETPTQEEIDAMEIGAEIYDDSDDKIKEVTETEVLQLVKYATIATDKVWFDSIESKLYFWSGANMVLVEDVDTTHYADGYFSIKLG